MDELTRAFLIKKFGEYYKNEKLEMPVEFDKREWAFVLLENLPSFVMRRHISFGSFQDFQAFVTSKVPAHIYYSSAYYLKPEIEKMEDKGWIKADLIFDVDADHIPLKSKSYKAALNRAKKEIFKLYNVLITEFGIDEKKIKIFFSGSRGYHIHVYEEDFQLLSSGERREIVDYLTINTERILNGRGFYDSLRAQQVSKLLTKYLKYLIKKEKLIDMLKAYRIRDVERVYTILSTSENLKRIENGDLSFLPKYKGLRMLINDLTDKILNNLRIYIDAPVTADVKRLIRMPSSLHGKTGLKVVEIKIDELDSFNPFCNAVVFGDEKVKVRILKRASFEIMGEKYSVRAGEKLALPEYAAILLMCRGMALYGH